MIYSTTVQAKTGHEIPLFLDQKPMHSKYNPVAEAETFARQSLENFCGNFLVVCGLGAGLHIQKLLELRPSLSIVVVEADQDSLNFCLEMESTKNLLAIKNFHTATPEQLGNKIKELYLPAFHGDMNIVTNRPWMNFCSNLVENISTTARNAIAEVSRDYSVQAHFGKLWQRNILLNLKNLKQNNFLDQASRHMDTKKTAAIIAAGPTLDQSITKLKDSIDQYEVFATDTAFPLLVENGIIPSLVMNIDSQNISHTHYLKAMDIIARKKLEKPVEEKTIFAFDICSNPETASLMGKDHETLFVTTGHPFASLMNQGGLLPRISSGSGTVTIAALDLARLMGFSKAELFGADFSYNNGKPYTKGTYLDRKYYSENMKLSTHENSFDALMFRTEIFPIASQLPFSGKAINPHSSSVLDSYCKSLILWCNEKGFKINDGIIRMEGKPEHVTSDSHFDYNTFVESFCSSMNSILENYSGNPQDLLEHSQVVALLPLIAFLRKNNETSTNIDFFDLLKLAYSLMLRYTVSYEK